VSLFEIDWNFDVVIIAIVVGSVLFALLMLIVFSLLNMSGYVFGDIIKRKFRAKRSRKK
jgi:hypothetical protein